MVPLGKTNSLISAIPPESIPIIIILVSIVGFTIIIERMVYFWRMKPITQEDMRKFKDLMREMKWDEARDYIGSVSNSPASSVLQVGLDFKRRGSKYVEDEMETEGYRQIHQMEKFLTGLGTIATIGPLLGVLGTVVGMIRSFGEGAGTKGAEVGISEALITTAMGLFISIPAYIFYNYLVRKKEERLNEIENLSNQAIQIFRADKK
ncbi:MAG: MotA/TolQ/ExbB proton channel family protein [Leptospiraceae bacterium]|nr:MotA/TolQ/ExbB proton channel family protein [Leptospiraceae bacterium]MCK6381722.1 MotA/TolQ/ExbB proton channel family protein [Leptospiraceae bacterium]NUM42046.1 MotA/TolQ/ExbB proton channel family protein [Leptospiraceae bacterium]